MFFLLLVDVSVSDMNEEDGNGGTGNGGGAGGGGSSKSNSVASEHSLQSTGVSASSQGSSTNSLPVVAAGAAAGAIDPETGQPYAALGSHHLQQGAKGGSAGRHHHHHLHPGAALAAASQGASPSLHPVATGFHRPQIQAASAKPSQVILVKFFPGQTRSRHWKPFIAASSSLR